MQMFCLSSRIVVLFIDAKCFANLTEKKLQRTNNEEAVFSKVGKKGNEFIQHLVYKSNNSLFLFDEWVSAFFWPLLPLYRNLHLQRTYLCQFAFHDDFKRIEMNDNVNFIELERKQSSLSIDVYWSMFVHILIVFTYLLSILMCS